MPSANQTARPWRPRLTLRVRFALLMALAVAVLGGVNRYYFETRFLGELESELEWRALSLARHMADDSVDLILYGDTVGLQRLLKSAKGASPDFAYAFVLDPSDRVVAHTFESDFPEALRLVNRHREASGYRVQRLEVFGETFRDFALPLLEGRLGVLRLGVRDKRVLDRVADIRNELLFLLAALMIASSAAAYLFTTFSLRPIDTIGHALERFLPGRRRDEIKLNRNDELGDLAAKVNEVTARLDDTHRSMTRTEKMASVGVMAAGIAHEINNPITGIQNCLRRIQQNPADAEQTAEYVAVMLKGTEHIEAVVRGLLDFSRASAQQMAELDLRAVIGRAVDLATLRLKKQRVELLRDEPGEPVTVMGDSAQLTQVVINVLLNAIDAIPDGGGTITIKLHSDGVRAEIKIRDTGAGIAAEDLPRVFDPFFTTKEVGKGTGLGLAVTHGIVSDHGGVIEIDSTPGKGTEVTIRLPVRGGKKSQ